MAALSGKRNSNFKRPLQDADVFCYICRGILIEPVTVPCKHVFCKSCFEDSLQETSYSCPLCRRRISNWLRGAKKTDKLLNLELWEQIKIQYKNEVECKLSGQDDGLDERLQQEFRSPSIITPSGEIGKECSKLLNDYEEELRREREKEEKASLELIKRLQKEELEEKERANNASYETITRLLEIDKSNEDADSSKKVVATPSSSSKKSSITAKDKKPVLGPMDYHIKRLSISETSKKTSHTQPIHLFLGRSCSSDSVDSISSEMHHFKPIRVVPKTPPKRSYDGKIVEVTAQKIVPLKLFTESRKQSSYAVIDPGLTIQSSFSAFKGKPAVFNRGDFDPPPEKRELIDNITESGILKEINLDENSDSNSVGFNKSDDAKNLDDSLGLKIPDLGVSLMDTENISGMEELFDREEQLRLEQRLLQEKADHELALKLSREWERSYELRRTRVLRAKADPRQTTLVNSVVRRRKK